MWGEPGGLLPRRLPIDVRAQVRTNAQNRDNTLPVSASTAFLTLARSKKSCLAACKLMEITAHLRT
jgi:hypothetical protein